MRAEAQPQRHGASSTEHSQMRPQQQRRDGSEICSKSEALKAVTLLMGCYRKDEAADPEIYIASAARVFMAYPLSVARTACDPVLGIPGKVQWLPSVAEIKAFCDRASAERVGERARQRMLEDQLRRRALPPPSDDAARERAIENVVGRFGRGWGLDAERVTEAAVSPEEACIAALGITKEQFDALEDVKTTKDSKPRVAPAGSFKPIGMAASSMSLSPDLAAKVAEKQREA
jgi:hypothetical protein